jgi:methylaspartate mutase sigma subunit
MAVIIGSLNGHAYEDLRDLPAARASGAIACPVLVGGNLTVGSNKDPHQHERLYRLGVDQVIADPGKLARYLESLAGQDEGPRREAEAS